VSESREDDDVAWLLARAKGESGPSISPARAARYAKLEALISELPARSEAAPRPDWQDRVLAAIEAEQAAANGATTGGIVQILRRKAWLIGVVGVAAAAALVWALAGR
jgi:hypothetical protein